MDESLSENEIKALIYLLDDDDQEVAAQVHNKIMDLGGTIIPHLEKQWESSLDLNTQKKIEDLIHTLQYKELKKRLLHWKLSKDQDLLEGLWIIATYQYPDLELKKLREDFEQLYYETWLDMQNDLLPHEQVRMLNQTIFSKLKFSGNSKNYYSPANSMINMVLESKKGNHISLSMVYLLIAQKLKFPIYGVNLPIIFVLTYKDEHNQFYINTFNKGIIFSKDDVENFLKQQNIKPLPMFFEPCSNLDIIKRCLRNLIVSFDKLSEQDKVEEVQELLATISDDELTDLI